MSLYCAVKQTLLQEAHQRAGCDDRLVCVRRFVKPCFVPQGEGRVCEA